MNKSIDQKSTRDLNELALDTFIQQMEADHNITCDLHAALLSPGSLSVLTRADLEAARRNQLATLHTPQVIDRLRKGLPTLAIVPMQDITWSGASKMFSNEGILYFYEIEGRQPVPVDLYLLVPGGDMGEMLVKLVNPVEDAVRIYDKIVPPYARETAQAPEQFQGRDRAIKTTPRLDSSGGRSLTDVKSAIFIMAAIFSLTVTFRKDLAKMLTPEDKAQARRVIYDDPHGSNEGQSSWPDRINEHRRQEYLEMVQQKVSGLERVLADSLETVDPNNPGYTIDALLSPYMVSKYLFDGKFLYRGRRTRDQGGGVSDQRIHRFALIGRKSGFYRDSKEADLCNKTTLADAINALLDYQNLSDEQIKKWIVWTYRMSFGADLDIENISLTRENEGGKVKMVMYGSDLPYAIINEHELIAGRAPGSQNSTQKVKKRQPLRDNHGHLLLPSGTSNEDGVYSHDLFVEDGFLPKSKQFTITFPYGRGSASWDVDTSRLATELAMYRNSLKNAHYIRGIIEGETVQMKSLSTAIDLQDPYAKSLAKMIVSGAKTPLDEAQRLTNFIQATKYVGEIDRDENRRLLMILFNGGGDCNGKLVPWATMMASRKLDFSILYLYDPNDKKYESHVMGAVGESVFPNGEIPRNKLVVGEQDSPIELTASGWDIGDRKALGKFQLVGMERYRYKADPDGGGTWEITKFQNNGQDRLVGSVNGRIKVE